MRITDAESRIMAVLWERHPMTAEQIIEALATRTDWRTGTVKAMLNRMLGKGTVTASRDGRRYLYSPAVTREECVRDESRRLLNRWFDGRLAPLVAHFSNTNDMSRTEIEELRTLLAELSDDD